MWELLFQGRMSGNESGCETRKQTEPVQIRQMLEAGVAPAFICSYLQAFIGGEATLLHSRSNARLNQELDTKE